MKVTRHKKCNGARNSKNNGSSPCDGLFSVKIKFNGVFFNVKFHAALGEKRAVR